MIHRPLISVTTITALLGLVYPSVASENNVSVFTFMLAAEPQSSSEVLDRYKAISDLPQSEEKPIDSVFLSQAGSEVTGNTFSPENARKSLLIDPLVLPETSTPPALPGSTFGVPSAYGASWRNAFVGGGFIGSGGFDRPVGNGQQFFEVPNDGSISFGAGFGDPVETVGFEVGIGIISLTDDFGDSGAIGFKLHKVFPEADDLAVAVGWTNSLTWGDANDAKETLYGVVTKAFDLQPGNKNPLPLTVTAGIGTGAFRSQGAFNAGTNDPNVFGSLGLRIDPQFSLISTWTGSQLNLGISTVPLLDIPFTLTLGAADITNNRGSGVRFLMTGGFGFKF